MPVLDKKAESEVIKALMFHLSEVISKNLDGPSANARTFASNSYTTTFDSRAQVISAAYAYIARKEKYGADEAKSEMAKREIAPIAAAHAAEGANNEQLVAEVQMLREAQEANAATIAAAQAANTAAILELTANFAKLMQKQSQQHAEAMQAMRQTLTAVQTELAGIKANVAAVDQKVQQASDDALLGVSSVEDGYKGPGCFGRR